MRDTRPRFLLVFQSGCSEVIHAADLDGALVTAGLLGLKYGGDPVTLVTRWRATTFDADEEEVA